MVCISLFSSYCSLAVAFLIIEYASVLFPPSCGQSSLLLSAWGCLLTLTVCFRVPVSGSSPSNHPHKTADSAASAQQEVLHLKQTYGGSQKHFVCRRSGGPFWLVDFICFLSRWNRRELSDQIKVQIWRLCSHEEHHICHQSFDKRINQPLYPHPSHFSFPLPPLFLSLLPFLIASSPSFGFMSLPVCCLEWDVEPPSSVWRGRSLIEHHREEFVFNRAGLELGQNHHYYWF